jgi:hypothetical protein
MTSHHPEPQAPGTAPTGPHTPPDGPEAAVQPETRTRAYGVLLGPMVITPERAAAIRAMWDDASPE